MATTFFPSPKVNQLPTVSVVVPVFRSATTLAELVSRLKAALPACSSKFEVVLVVDGSPDESWEIIKKLSARHPEIVGLKLMRNFGQHSALLAGIRRAKYDYVVTLDDDLQTPPEEIHKLLSVSCKNGGVVYGVPRQKKHIFWKNWGSSVLRLALTATLGATNARNASSFRAFPTVLRKAFDHYDGDFVYIDVLLNWGATLFQAVQVEHAPRKAGESNYSFFSLARHAINMVTGFSSLPLRGATALGLSTTFLGVAILAWVLGRYWVEGGSVPGFPFLASSIAIFSGVQLFALGVIGEYIARIHFRVMKRPPYVVSEQVTKEDEITFVAKKQG